LAEAGTCFDCPEAEDPEDGEGNRSPERRWRCSPIAIHDLFNVLADIGRKLLLKLSLRHTLCIGACVTTRQTGTEAVEARW
jgi:hypothetical protein